MAPKIFVTGGTGYIGGSVLHTIVTSHPDYEVSVLLRNIPDAFSSTYPNVKIIKGDYDSFDVLADAASKANLVVHNGNSDHEPSLNAIIAGLLRRSTPGFLMHLSGTAVVVDLHAEKYLGKAEPKIWSDTSNLADIWALPDTAPHRNTEKILNETVAKHGDKINIAIMCPPDIYGRGKGLAKTWSAYVPMFIDEAKKLGAAFYYGDGSNFKSWVHIEDLMHWYLKVVEAAASGGGGLDWGKDGYYFAGTQEVSQLDIAKVAGPVLKKHGVIQNGEPQQISLSTLDSMLQAVPYPKISRYMFALNSRTRPERAQKLWGYKGSAPGLLEVLEQDIADSVEKK
ncbi:NAD(P)-binding protein [Massariosphaeria phaeospora]|uniref:NAD(P)-binding protein n=1 Tax=Massariosphaeria phaeospora TaxID=100035 RepID=A0A7C8MAE4_9PLEO|nr:NAD(P)-binding protein [Massariosphaeria phaeospora]